MTGPWLRFLLDFRGQATAGNRHLDVTGPWCPPFEGCMLQFHGPGLPASASDLCVRTTL